MNRLILLVESRIRGDVYVRFGGELPKTHRSNTAGRWMLSLRLIFTLRQMKITKNEEVNAILRLSDYGRLKGYVWQVIHNTRWSEIVAKGKYLIAALVKEKKKTGN